MSKTNPKTDYERSMTMGTNFYWKEPRPQMLPEVVHSNYVHDTDGSHIGKRSAAGLYCWDCNVTLCREGVERIHSGYGTFADKCPKCGRGVDTAPSLDVGPVAVELGFAKPADARPRGVSGCASFGWALPPEKVRAECEACGEEVCIEDEYGTEMTGLEFLRMLKANCPIEHTDSIGVMFS